MFRRQFRFQGLAVGVACEFRNLRFAVWPLCGLVLGLLVWAMGLGL